MTTSTVYHCEFCDAEFSSEEECREHENTHIKNYSKKSSEEIAEDLKFLEEVAYGYRFGQSVMGMPLASFENLMREAANRLLDKGE